MYIVVGLGNPGEEYKNTRHNTGRLAQEFIAKDEDVKVKHIHLDTYMNKSGDGVVKHVKSKKAAQKLIVLYDDLDLPLGTIKISYNRGTGGHKGLESIVKRIKTLEFIRIRIGISPTTPSGKMKKPQGEDAVEKHILGEFKKSEEEVLKKVFKRVKLAVKTIVEEGLPQAMTEINSK
jgi:peptidyl-tRNA hydrolase, PTH1 family